MESGGAGKGLHQFQAERGHVQLWGELEKNREQGLEKVTFGDLDMASTRTHTLWAERTTQRRQGGARKRGQLGLSTGPHPGLSHSLGGGGHLSPLVVPLLWPRSLTQ